jgi:nucleoside phosphorylase
MTIKVTQEHFDKASRTTGVSDSVTLTEEAARTAASDAAARVYGRIRLAILNAIPHEHAATLAIFGQAKSIPSREHVESSIKYVCVPRSGNSDMYVAFSGITGQGIAQAAAAAAQVKYKCRHVNKIFLVGIAAGQPNLMDKEKDVRLGDIVVGSRIIQYDHIKLEDGRRELRGNGLPPADPELVSIVDTLRACQDLRGTAAQAPPWQNHLVTGMAGVRKANRPDKADDTNYNMRSYLKGLEQERNDDCPFVHVGVIGSASTLLKDARFRDSLNKEYGTIAYEMEGAGLAIAAASAGVGYLIVRGICDYGDRLKNDAWQTYASVCAAAFVRTIIENM